MADPLHVLHLAPHPDDEAIGASATLLGLVAAGHHVTNLACSLGRPEQHERRRAELVEACRRAGFALEILEPPLGLSRRDDLARSQSRLTEEIEALLVAGGVDLLVAPSPHDGHHGHEVVGRAARDAVARAARPPRLWLWGIWSDLPLPTLFVPFGEETLERILWILGAHAGEVARNDYPDLIGARGRAGRVLGSERVFGFGSAEGPGPYAELLCEVACDDGEWWAGAARILDAEEPVAEVPRDRPLGWWMRSESFAARLAAAQGSVSSVAAPGF